MDREREKREKKKGETECSTIALLNGSKVLAPLLGGCLRAHALCVPCRTWVRLINGSQCTVHFNLNHEITAGVSIELLISPPESSVERHNVVPYSPHFHHTTPPLLN